MNFLRHTEIVKEKDLDKILKNIHDRLTNHSVDYNQIQKFKGLYKASNIEESDKFKYVERRIENELISMTSVMTSSSPNKLMVEKSTQTEIREENSPLDLIKLENWLVSNNYINDPDPQIILNTLNAKGNYLNHFNVNNDVDLSAMKMRLIHQINDRMRMFLGIIENFNKIKDIVSNTKSLLDTKQRNHRPINYQNILYALGKNREDLDKIDDYNFDPLINFKRKTMMEVHYATEEINNKQRTQMGGNNKTALKTYSNSNIIVKPTSSKSVALSQKVVYPGNYKRVTDDDITVDKDGVDDGKDIEKDLIEYMARFRLKTPENPTKEFINEVLTLVEHLESEIVDYFNDDDGTVTDTDVFKFGESLSQLRGSLDKISNHEYPHLTEYKIQVMRYINKLMENLDQAANKMS